MSHSTAIPSGLDQQWSVAMFSFTTELVLGYRSPQQLLQDAADAGIAGRFEMDGFAHFRTFPEVSKEDAEAFRADLAQRGLEVTELGLYDDRYFPAGHNAALDGRVEALSQQIEAASALGFPAVKVMWGMDLEVLERLRPVLEHHEIALYQEAQGSLTPDDPELDRQLSFASRHPDRFGFVFDLSACMYGAPVSYLEELRTLGIPDPVVALIRDEWPHDRTERTKARVLELTAPLDLPATTRMRLMMPFGRFGTSRVSSFHDLIDVAQVVHLKFWDLIDEAGIVSDPMRDLAHELRLRDYQGPITSEWGGHEWLDGPENETLRVLADHRRLYERASLG